ncbi:MAG: DNRLRE domain-containing protein [Acidobacteriota bacterium]|nr:DNRLRE domain-containing protein [Acidobacteriota bacterium]
MWRLILIGLLLLPWPASAGEVVRIEADRDATLIESADGSLANGSGPSVFIGRTSQSVDSRRRALLRFDVAGTLPRDAVIDSVTLTVFVNPSNSQPSTVTVHRLLSDWSEGPSSASGGGGRPAEPGDVTWIHTDYDDARWPRPGGHFVPHASASATLSIAALYSFQTHELARDVRRWLVAPHRNFGWLLIGDESQPQTAKNLASRESADPSRRPVLEIRYRVAAATDRR